MILNEGIPVLIEWHKMVLGSSFFIPSLQTEQLEEQILEAGNQRRIKLRCKETVENGIIGLRVWRIK